MRLATIIATYAAIAYLSAGAALGSLLYFSIPAMNVLGWGFYAVTWPVFVCEGTKACKGDASWLVPSWAFTFKERAQ